MNDNEYTALFQYKDGKEFVFTGTFGRKIDQYLWNQAWCREHYDLKTIGPEGRNWFGNVNAVGIQQLKDLGYAIKRARVIADEESK